MGVTFPGESAEYRAARDKLIEKEVELRRAMEAVAEARRALPKGGVIPQDYEFDGVDARGEKVKVKLSQLFAPRTDTLIVYNMMFPRFSGDDSPGAKDGETAKLPRKESPCPGCTGLLDNLDGAVLHLTAAGVNFAVVAKTSIDRLVNFAKERSWKHMRMLSSANNSFKRDYHAESDDGESIPMLSVFQRDGDQIRHFWSSELMFAQSDPGQHPRHNGTIESLWNMLDLTPQGRTKFNEQLQY